MGAAGYAKLHLSRQNVHSMTRLEREDLFDSLLEVRSDMNRVMDDNTKIKTRNAILMQQIKAKNKFIDELLKSTRALGGTELYDKAMRSGQSAMREASGSPGERETMMNDRKKQPNAANRISLKTMKDKNKELNYHLFVARRKLRDTEELLELIITTIFKTNQ